MGSSFREAHLNSCLNELIIRVQSVEFQGFKFFAEHNRGKAHIGAGNKRAALADYERLVRLGSPLAGNLKEAIDKLARNQGSASAIFRFPEGEMKR